MKVVSAKKMSELEQQAYQQGCSEQAFMEKAGQGIAETVHQFIQDHLLEGNVLLLCGKGNNGGDAFVAGRYLIEQGYVVTALQLAPWSDCSPLCQQNGQRFLQQGGQLVHELPLLQSFSVLLDGLFGTGFKGMVKEPYASIIKAANQSRLPILAVDIPSGLNGSTGLIEGPAIQATQTIFLGLPKTGFFLKDGWNVVGELRGVDFGLPAAIVEQAPADFMLLTAEEMAQKLPPIQRNRHKYQRGQVIGLAGSPGMPGAALMSSFAAFRGGSGMVRLLHPDGMQDELAPSPYELIKVPYTYEEPQKVLEWLEKGHATFVGPGLGRTEAVGKLLKVIMPQLTHPCVIDADALNLFAAEAFELPSQAILTPHLGEMQTLLHSSERLSLDEDLLTTCQAYAEQHKITLILKGAPTFIFHPQQPILVNPTGDPGMAAAGSGDVLTGLLAALLAQGLPCYDAAALGVYLHGLAGQYAAQTYTSYSMMATDLIHYFAEAYAFLQTF